VLRLALLVGTFMTLATGPREQSFRMLLTFLVVLVPRALDVPRPFDLAFVSGMSFQAWGNVFGAFNGIHGYDKVVHFVLPFATSALLYLVLVRVSVVPDLGTASGLHNRAAMILTTFSFGLAVGGIYELYEWFGDNVLGAHLYTSYGDTIGDLTDDAAGSLLGGALIMFWDRAGWGTRRAPARRSSRQPIRRDPLETAGSALVGRLPAAPSVLNVRRKAPSWAPVLTLLADVCRVSFFAGCIYSLTQAQWEQSARFALTLVASLVPRLLRTPRPFDAIFALAMAFQAWGDISGAFAHVSGYGYAVRLTVSIAAGPALYLILIRIRAVPDFSRERAIRERVATALLGFAFGFSAGIFYELYVWVADHLLGAQMSVTYDELIRRLALDAVGATIGAMLLVAWDEVGWGIGAGSRTGGHR
jgi:hypothetical protein